jgi:Amt family ammonium transporter
LLKRVAFLLNQVVRLGEFNFFSLNDFGSGLSSFTYLKNLPVDYLKIDGSFVRDIDNDKVSYAMVKSINEIGHAMGLKTIAERVENKAILTRLKKIGVDFAQGYHIHKPKPLIVPANAKPA